MINDLIIFFKGFLLGFSVSAPVGPIGVICIQQTLLGGFLLGIFSGLGAASADGIYASISGFGLSWLSNFLIKYKTYINIFGGIYLLYLGISIFFSRISGNVEIKSETNLLKSYLSTFFLTAANPLTIIFYTAIFATLDIDLCGFFSALSFVSGVFVGSVTWWIILCSGINLFRHKVDIKSLNLVNRLSGIAVMLFGVFAISYSVLSFLIVKKGVC
ncbi:LysE family translocator [Candidatus Dependentiae bacterium]|nr:LysE family translocator [Candidatus Dependentiae bacterium]